MRRRAIGFFHQSRGARPAGKRQRMRHWRFLIWQPSQPMFIKVKLFGPLKLGVAAIKSTLYRPSIETGQVSL